MKNTLAKIALFLTIVVFTIAAGYVFIVQHLSVDMDAMLKEVDQHVALSNYSSAEYLLMQMSKKNLNSYGWLRLIKRAHEIALVSNDYKALAKISEKATKSLPGAEELWAFYIKALVEQKKYEQAKKLAEKHLTSNRFYPIRAEAVLLYQNNGDLALIEEQLKASSDPYTYLQVAQQLRNPLLFYDAALLFLERGDREQAGQLLPLMMSAETPSLGVAVIAYDTENYTEALRELSQPSSEIFVPYNPPRGQVSLSEREKISIYRDAMFLKAALTADTRLYFNDRQGAYENYLKANSIDGQRSWEVWQNIAILSEELNSGIDVEDHYRNALLNFPKRKELTLALANKLENRSEAENLVNSFLEVAPLDPEVNLFWIENFAPEVTPEHRTSDLWNIFNAQHSANKRLSQYMIWFFLGIRSYDDASIIIDRYTGRDREWIVTYKALIEAAKGNYKGALVLFNQEKKLGWEIFYNKALIHSYEGDYRMAIDLLVQAENSYRDQVTNADGRDLSKIFSKMGMVYVKMNVKSMAIKMAEKALEADENNMEALRILRDSVYML